MKEDIVSCLSLLMFCLDAHALEPGVLTNAQVMTFTRAIAGHCLLLAQGADSELDDETRAEVASLLAGVAIADAMDKK